jgi:hypothetical protein
MTKSDFILYVSTDNPGFYKTRKTHIKKQFPEILQEIEEFISFHNLNPINFNDAVYYYINDCVTQNRCVCGKLVRYNYVYCSYKCKQENINVVLNKTKNTLKKRYGEDHPLKIKQFKEKFQNTCLDKFGVTHPAKNDVVREKIRSSNNETYKDEELRKSLGKKISDAYKENGLEIIEKRKQTNLEKYGEYTTLPACAIIKAKCTLQERYGVTNPFEIHEDTHTNARLGALNFFKNKENKDKSIQKRINTIISKYGSLDKMNEFVFQKTKEKTIQQLKNIGIKDTIIKYDYNKLGFVTCKGKECDHEYDISLHLLRDRNYRQDICCTICSPPLTKWVSTAEIEIFNWLSAYIECEQNNRKNLTNKEIDIYISNKNLAIEFNGIYWHSDLFKDKNYHLNKTLFLKTKNINLIHIWEDLWNNKKEIIKQRILSKLNINRLTIGARKCILKEISSSDANNFYENNHLQGKTRAFKYIALFYNNEIVSCLSFGKRKLGKNKNKNTFEILRFCNKLRIDCIGSFSKLFKYIINKYPGDYISYADLCWGEGKVYEYAGFKLKEFSKPNYWYFVDNVRYHRYTFRKNELIKMGYDKNKTEFQIMDDDIKALRVYDCGNAVWEYKNI